MFHFHFRYHIEKKFFCLPKIGLLDKQNHKQTNKQTHRNIELHDTTLTHGFSHTPTHYCHLVPTDMLTLIMWKPCGVVARWWGVRCWGDSETTMKDGMDVSLASLSSDHSLSPASSGHLRRGYGNPWDGCRAFHCTGILSRQSYDSLLTHAIPDHF
jgi:hypothetical protein